MSLKPKVALSQDFLLQLAKLPVSVQSKVMKWAIQFQSDPTSPGINYENINGYPLALQSNDRRALRGWSILGLRRKLDAGELGS